MLNSIIRSVVAGLVVGVVYLAYAKGLAPWLEPHQRWAEPQGEAYPPVTQSIDLSAYFPAGSWQRDVATVRVVQMQFGFLVFRDLRRRDNNRLEVEPVSAVIHMNSSGAATTLASADALVMEAPEGAILDLPRPRNRSGSIGAPKSGRLVGPITIRQVVGKDGGPALRCATRNVQITPERVWTASDVEFQWGRSHGKGKELSILLQQESRDRSSGAAEFAGIRSLTIRRVDHLVLDLASSPWGDKLANDPAQAGLLQLSCEGPFQLDLRRNVALFEQQVLVRLVRPELRADTLSCQFLELHFRHTRDSKPTRLPPSDSPAASPKGQQALQLVRIQAAGSPVQLTSPERGLDAQGELLRFDVETRRFLLDGPQVSFRLGTHQVRAARLEYELHAEDPRRLGRMWAHGPGRLDSTLGDQESPFFAEWNEVLQLQPFEGQHVLSFASGATLGVDGLAGFTADELHLYLREEADPAAMAPPGPTPPHDALAAAAPAAQANPTVRLAQRIAPDRMLARGHVRFQSQPAAGAIEELKVWFADSAAVPAGQASAVQQPPPQKSTHPWRQWSGPPLQVDGKLAQMQVRLGPQGANIEQASLSGGVSISQPHAEPARQWSMRGDSLEYLGIRGSVATLIGQPATLQSTQGVLEASRIAADPVAHHVQVLGAGRLRMTNPAAGLRPLEIVWNQGVSFDSLTAQFQQLVEFRGEHSQGPGRILRFYGRADSLTVTLNQPLAMSKGNAATRSSLDLAALSLASDPAAANAEVYFESVRYQDELKTAHDRVFLRSLAINRSDGEIHGQGPGRAVSTRAGGLAMPSLDGSLQALRSKQTPATAPGELTFLEVSHQGELAGNIHTGYLRLQQDVRALIGPVNDWEQQLHIADRKQLGDRMAQLFCNQLTVSQSVTALDGQRKPLRLAAEGNAQVIGRRFFAQTERLSYDQSKDMLVLEGGAREPALLEMQRTPDASPQSIRAERFLFWPQTMDFRMENGQGFFSGPLRAEPAR